MKKNKNGDNVLLAENVQSLGIDLDIVNSLLNFLYAEISENYEINKIDIENLVIVLKRMLNNISKTSEKIETLMKI